MHALQQIHIVGFYLKYQVALARMCEYVLRFNINSAFIAVIKTGTSNRFVFVILILFDASVNNWVSVNFNISAIIFNRRRKKFYVTFKPDTFIRLTRSLNCNCIRSIWTIDTRSIYQFIKINCTCINIFGYNSFTFLVISSGGTITLATCFHSDILLQFFRPDANCFAALLEKIIAKKFPMEPKIPAHPITYFFLYVLFYICIL